MENKLSELRQDIISECSKAINIAKMINEDDSSHIIIKKISEQIAERVNVISDLCSVDKFNLFFNGKVALGKSTAICNIFGLIDEAKLVEKANVNSFTLLKTGSGRITVCETRIIPDSEISHIEVEPVGDNEFSAYLDQFCRWINGDVSDLSEEESRLIRNMSKLPQSMTLISEISQYLSEITKENYSYLESVIDYQNRDCTSFTYSKYEDGEFTDWIKKVYESINDGVIEKCPMPKKISVYISKSDLALHIPEWIGSIVDTRGIDGGERSDLQEYLMRNDSISFMCDEVNSFGGNESIITILKQNLIKENKDSKYRTVLLGLERENELESISGFEDNRNGGIKSKTSQALKKITDNEIYFNEKNIMFVNTIPGTIVSQKKVIELNKTDRMSGITTFLKEIDDLLCRMYKEYTEEIYENLKTLTQLSNGKISSETIAKFSKCQEYVLKSKSSAELKSNSILQRFENATLEIYHSSLRGAVNHNGVGRTADVYASFQKCGGEEFKERCLEHKSNLVVLVENLFENCNELEAICYQSILDEIDKVYLNLYHKNRKLHHDLTYEKLYNDDAWKFPKSYWGDRLGNYNARVTKDILNEIRNRHIDRELVSKKLETIFFDTLYDFLEIS